MPPRPAGAVLRACITEADRQARTLTRLDHAFGAQLAAGGAVTDLATLQLLDMARQEAEGLARALRLAVSAPSSETLLDPGTLAAAMPLAAQRARLTK